MATQCDRVLGLLQQRGERGLNTTDLMAPACDGGKPILRLAARVRDLQDQGYKIRSERKMNGTATYFLAGDVERVPDREPSPRRPSSPVGDSLSAGLFNANEFQLPPRPKFYDEAA